MQDFKARIFVNQVQPGGIILRAPVEVLVIDDSSEYGDHYELGALYAATESEGGNTLIFDADEGYVRPGASWDMIRTIKEKVERGDFQRLPVLGNSATISIIRDMTTLINLMRKEVGDPNDNEGMRSHPLAEPLIDMANTVAAYELGYDEDAFRAAAKLAPFLKENAQELAQAFTLLIEHDLKLTGNLDSRVVPESIHLVMREGVKTVFGSENNLAASCSRDPEP